MKHLKCLAMAALMLLTATTAEAKQNKQTKTTRNTFAIADGQFVYNGKPMQLHSGEMHYARVPAPYLAPPYENDESYGLERCCHIRVFGTITKQNLASGTGKLVTKT